MNGLKLVLAGLAFVLVTLSSVDFSIVVLAWLAYIWFLFRWLIRSWRSMNDQVDEMNRNESMRNNTERALKKSDPGKRR